MSDFGFLETKPPFSKGEIDRLGHYYAGTRDEPPPRAAEILTWHEDLAKRVELEIGKWIRTHAGGELISLTTASRVKSRSTIATKVRDRNLQLSRIQDFVGTRFSWNCLHGTLLDTASSIAGHLTGLGFAADTKNYLEAPQQGYRAVHLWVQSPAGRFEVQLRTLLQSEWANVYEKLADITGRRIRYEDDYQPEDPELRDAVVELHEISHSIYELERKTERIYRTEAKVYRDFSEAEAQLPTVPESHQTKAEVLRLLTRSELAKVDMATVNRDLLESLHRMAVTIVEYGKIVGSDTKEDSDG